MRLPIQAKPVARGQIGGQPGSVRQSDCCGGGQCCLGTCLFGKCIGACVPNIGQC